MPLKRTFGIAELDALVRKHCISDSSSESSSDSSSESSSDNSDEKDARIEKEFQERMDKLNIKASEQIQRFKACQERLKFYQSIANQDIPEQLSKSSSGLKLHK